MAMPTIRARFPDTPQSELCAVLDYTTYPPQYSIERLDADTTVKADGLEEEFRSWRKGEGAGLMVRTDYLLGITTRSVITLRLSVSNQLALRDGDSSSNLRMLP